MAKKVPAQTKRQAIREQRLRRQRQQRIAIIGGIVVVALIIAGILIAPSIYEAMAPVGEIVQITPAAHSMVDGNALGPVDAPVVVEVYSDFQCPACRSFSADIEPQIVQNYVETGQVRYVYRHFPFLDDRVAGNESDQAANASMCAAEQGRFWDYHDILFANWNGENRGAFSDRRLEAFAEALGLDMGAFRQCFNENRFEDQINADLEQGIQAGVQGTPTVFVNGERVGDPGFVPTYEQISQAIEAGLAAGG